MGAGEFFKGTVLGIGGWSEGALSDSTRDENPGQTPETSLVDQEGHWLWANICEQGENTRNSPEQNLHSSIT